MTAIIKTIAGELQIKEHQVLHAVKLLFDEGCTIPFVARYRKEMTGSLDEVALRAIRDRHLYLVDLEQNKVIAWYSRAQTLIPFKRPLSGKSVNVDSRSGSFSTVLRMEVKNGTFYNMRLVSACRR